jgi:transcriptional regulator with XRE-family HTH domain
VKKKPKNNSRHDNFLKEVGNNVRRMRKEKGYTMQDLANELDMEYRQLSRIERGEVNTSVYSLLRIAEKLEIDPHIFLVIPK